MTLLRLHSLVLEDTVHLFLGFLLRFWWFNLVDLDSLDLFSHSWLILLFDYAQEWGFFGEDLIFGRHWYSLMFRLIEFKFVVHCQLKQTVVRGIKVVEVFESVFCETFFYLFHNSWVILTTKSAIHFFIELIFAHYCEALNEFVSKQIT